MHMHTTISIRNTQCRDRFNQTHRHFQTTSTIETKEKKQTDLVTLYYPNCRVSQHVPINVVLLYQKDRHCSYDRTLCRGNPDTWQARVSQQSKQKQSLTSLARCLVNLL